MDGSIDPRPSLAPHPAPNLRLSARLVRFGLVGGLGVIVNLSILALLVEGSAWHPLAAALVSIELSTVTNFLLNRFWTWRDRERSWWSLLSYHGVTLVGILIQYGVLAVTSAFFGLHYLLAALVGIGAGTAWNFVANHHFTFTHYTPERKRALLRVTAYAAALALHVFVAAVLTHDWDTFVFQRSVEDFVSRGVTPYDTGIEKPDYAYVGVGLPFQPLWYAYPPLPLLAMTLSYAPMALGLSSSPWLGRVLIKLPFIGANLLVAWLGHRLATTSPDPDPERLAKAARLERFLLFNPLVIAVAAIWGQFESLLIAFLFLSFFALRSGRWAVGGALWGLALLVKIFPLYLGPILVLHIVRRRGLGAAARYFAAGAGVFAAISLPFILLQPGGFLEQVLLLHSERRPGRFAPVAFLFENLRWAGREWPGLFPTDAAMISGLSLLSFGLTAIVLLLLAAASLRDPANERNLILWSGLSLLGGLLATKVVSEQYVLLPLVFLAAYYFYPGRDVPGAPDPIWIRRFLITSTVFVCIAATLDNAHFLVFLPEDVANRVLGVTVPEALFGLAGVFGLTPAEFRILVGTLGAVGLLVPFVVGVRIISPALRDGFHRAVRFLEPARKSHRPHLSPFGRVTLIVLVFLLLSPALAVGLLSPRRDMPPVDSGFRDGPLVLVHYRADWYNPTKRPELAAGNWVDVDVMPEAGYYDSTSHKFARDLEVMRVLGIDGFVLAFDPVHEYSAAALGFVAEAEQIPYALEVDLGHIANAEGVIPLTAESRALAGELLDGPGGRYYRGSYQLRLSPEGGLLVFLAGAQRVQPTFTEDELRHVAEYLPEEFTLDAALSTLTAAWTSGPRSLADLEAESRAARAWQGAYARAELDWWSDVFDFVDNDTRIDLVTDAIPPEGVRAVDGVQWVGSYEPVAVHAPPTPPQPALDGVRFTSVPARPGPVGSYDAAWIEALGGDPEGILVPWNDFDEGLAIEPTRAEGDALLRSTEAWTRAYHAAGPEAAAAPPQPSAVLPTPGSA